MEINLPEIPIKIFSEYKIPLILVAVGLLLLLIGVRSAYLFQSPQVEFIEKDLFTSTSASGITVDVAGSVEKPGLYNLTAGSRIQDALVAAGGLAYNADREWIAKYTNLAARLIDGTKIYIPAENENQTNQNNQLLGVVSNAETLINLNTASIAELDTLSGVGQVTAQKIIDNRPYNSVEELLTKKVVNNNTFDKIKDRVSVY